MPGKVNPTQCEAITMVAAQVMGNQVTAIMFTRATPFPTHRLLLSLILCTHSPLIQTHSPRIMKIPPSLIPLNPTGSGISRGQ